MLRDQPFKLIDDVEYFRVDTDTYETKLDDDRTKHRIEYVRDGNQKIIKQIKSKIKVTKKLVPKRVIEREHWKPFGQALQGNNGITMLGKPFTLNLSFDFKHASDYLKHNYGDDCNQIKGKVAKPKWSDKERQAYYEKEKNK